MIGREATNDESPIACRLSGGELARRGVDVDDLFGEAEQVRELADGYEFRFKGGDAEAGRLLEFTLTERACCPFFTFELAFEPNHGAIWLRLRGGAGVKEFIVGSWGDVLAAHA